MVEFKVKYFKESYFWSLKRPQQCYGFNAIFVKEGYFQFFWVNSPNFLV